VGVSASLVSVLVQGPMTKPPPEGDGVGQFADGGVDGVVDLV
jgi:hypothetical protein